MASNLRVDSIVPATGSSVSIGTATGGVSIPGVLTYEDVTNVDSVGVITARSGIRIGATGANTLITGNTSGIGIGTANPQSILDISKDISAGVNEVNIRNHHASGGAALRVKTQGTYGSPLYHGILGASDSGGTIRVGAVSNHPLLLLTNNTEKLRITSGGQTIVKGVDDQDNFVVDVGGSEFAVHTDATDGEISLRAQDGSGNNYSKYMTFFTHPSGSAAAERLRISSEGHVTKPNNLCLQYTGTGDITSGDVIYATKVFDVGTSNAYNTSNGEFTAPVTGVYRIQYEHFASGAGRATAGIQKHNGSSWSTVKNGMRVYSVSGGSNWASVPTIFYLQLNATEKFKIIHQEGTVHLNTPWNHMTVQLVQ